MASTSLTFSRRHILGDLYAKCEPITDSVPVYLIEEEKVLLGHADESMGIYADAMTFHLPDDICKKLSSGQYACGFDLENSVTTGKAKINGIFLKVRKPYEKPLPARRSTS